MLESLFVIAQQAADPGAGGGQPPDSNMWVQTLLMFAPLMIIFYVLFIRPESKRRHEKDALLGALKPRDKVVTIGGLHGTVVEITGDEVVLLVDSKKDVKLRFRRSAIDSVAAAEEKKEDKK